jgi:hypothetical protein
LLHLHGNSPACAGLKTMRRRTKVRPRQPSRHTALGPSVAGRKRKRQMQDALAHPSHHERDECANNHLGLPTPNPKIAQTSKKPNVTRQRRFNKVRNRCSKTTSFLSQWSCRCSQAYFKTTFGTRIKLEDLLEALPESL